MFPRLFLVFLLGLPVYAQWTSVGLPITPRYAGHSWADVDGDGDSDLFIHGRWLLFLNRLNEGLGFEDVTAEMIGPRPSGTSVSATFGDFDNDGDPDLFLGRSNTDQLLLNNWPDPFVDVAATYGLDNPEFVQTINWVDYNLDGLLDLYITLELDGLASDGGDRGHRFYESDYPNGFIKRFPTIPGGVDTFGLFDRNSHAYGLAWGDLDLDGDIDAVTTGCNPSGSTAPYNTIYRNNHPNIGFTNVSVISGFIDTQETVFGSGGYWVALMDYDNDGKPDISIGDGPSVGSGGDHRLWRNTSNGSIAFDEVPVATHGISGSSAYFESGSAGDIDNDGDLDFYTTAEGLYLNNGDGSFTQRLDLLAGGIYDSSMVDVDGDGFLDIFNYNNVYINPADTDNHWLSVELVGNPSRGTTRSAHNTKIRVGAAGQTYHREHRFMVGTYSQNMVPTHFGLGVSSTVDTLQVTWPGDGSVASFTDVVADQNVTVIQDPCTSYLQTTLRRPDLIRCTSDTIVLQAQASDDNGVSYQWRKDGIDLPGETGPVLTINLGNGASGDYDCLIDTGSCTVTTATYPVVTGSSPAIETQPEPFFYVYAGATINLEITLNEGDFNYTWTRSGTPVGANQPSLLLSNIRGSDRGIYRCAVDGGCDQPVLSEEAIVCVVSEDFETDRIQWPLNTSVLQLTGYLRDACP